MNMVTLRDVTKRFGQVAALDSVSLEVRQGELIALLGPSGCGKTTLLRSVAGLERPDSGVITIREQDMSVVSTRERPIGMVFQHYALFPNMTVRENIAFPLKVRREPSARIGPRVDEMLALVRLIDQADRYPHQISGGQAQRCALGRALAPAPDVLLLDEPLSALDALVRVHLRDEIRRVQQLVQTTALYVTHDQAEAMAIADRVAVMNHGRIEQLATPAELYDAPGTRFAAGFVGSRNAIELPVRDGLVAFGGAFVVPAPPGAIDRALAFFRPEDVIVSAADRQGQPAVIDMKVFLGASTRLHLRSQLEGGLVTLEADVASRQAQRFGQGDAVAVSVDPDHVTTFPVAPRPA